MSSNNTSSAEFMGDVRCRCGYLAPLKMSWSYANPGKRYRACPRYGGNERCRYFEWMDYDVSERVAKVIRGLLKRANNYEREIEKLNLTVEKKDLEIHKKSYVGSLAAAAEIKSETIRIALSPPVA
nr:GRF zinc finger protein [Ipomoea batatas]